MEYLFNFIEYISESNLFSILTLAIAVCFLVMLYVKKEEYESYLGLKMLGYYFLGSFNFNLNMNWIVIAIPLGFCIYYFGMKKKEKLNSKSKNKAAILGVIMLYVGTVNGMIYEKVEYRDRTVTIEDTKLQNIGIDYRDIKAKIGIKYGVIENLDLSYDSDGKIKYLRYIVRDNDKNCYIFYEDNEYKVSVNKNYNDGEWYYNDQTGNYEAESILDMISSGKFNKYENASTSRINYEGNRKNYKLSDEDYNIRSFYRVNPMDHTIKQIDKIEGVTDALAIEYRGIVNPSDSKDEECREDIYVLSCFDMEYSSSYDSLQIEKVDSNVSIIIDNQDDLRKIYKATKEEPYGWSEVQDLKIDFEPDIFVKYSDGSKIGFCEERPFARVEKDGTSLWYIVGSDLYTLINGQYIDSTYQLKTE